MDKEKKIMKEGREALRSSGPAHLCCANAEMWDMMLGQVSQLRCFQSCTSMDNKKAPHKARLFYYGGPSTQTPTLNVLTDELYEIIKAGRPKPWENADFLTDLYVNKGWSLRRISDELGCSRFVVRKQLKGFMKTDFKRKKLVPRILGRKILWLRAQDLSYEKIAARLNFWKIQTQSGEGQWHAKTVREIEKKFLS